MAIVTINIQPNIVKMIINLVIALLPSPEKGKRNYIYLRVEFNGDKTSGRLLMYKMQNIESQLYNPE